MLAVVLYGPNDLRLEEITDPSLPPGGLVVRTCTVGICGSDVRNWHYGSHRLRGPQVLGHEMAGTVEESDCPDFVVGTRVAICPGMPCLHCRFCQRGQSNLCLNRHVFAYDLPGGMAEAMGIPAEALDRGCVVKVPDSVPLEFAPLSEPLHTILNGQDRAAVGLQESVLVLGLGPVGILHAFVAASRGASPVLGVDPLVNRAKAAGELLAPLHSMDMSSEWENRALELTDGQGWDVVIIANTSPTAISTAIQLSAANGRILAFAGVSGDAKAASVDLSAVHYRQLEVIGAFGGSPRYYQRAVRWLAEHPLPLSQLVTAQLPLAQALEGFARVERGDGFKTMLCAA